MGIVRKYAWKPDVPDQRDFKFAKLVKDKNLKTTQLPESITLRKWCSEVEDQGQLGSCTGNALVGGMEYNECKTGNGGKNFVNLSRLFVYYNERSIEGTVNEDSGAMIRDGIKSLANSGVCPESEWHYDLRRWKVKPSTKCYTDALKYKISNYYRLDNTDLNQLKAALANYHPFVFGFSVYESFESDEVANTGIVNMPSTSERLLGGHAVCCIGYDDKTKRFLVRNSWGKSWGLSGNLKGYFTIPYDYLTNTNLADDFWVIVK